LNQRATIHCQEGDGSARSLIMTLIADLEQMRYF